MPSSSTTSREVGNHPIAVDNVPAGDDHRAGDACCVHRDPGFPGVSFVTGDDERQVGEAAERVGEKAYR